MQNCNGNATAPFHDSWFVSIKLDWTVFSYTFCQSEQNSKLNNYPRLFYHFSYYLVPSSIYESVALTVIEESDKMSLASKLASNVIKKAPSGPVRISYRRFINSVLKWWCQCFNCCCTIRLLHILSIYRERGSM